jgi:hypothetical protein
MEARGFATCRDGFHFLDLVARLSFKSESGVSLAAGRETGETFVVKGWIDAHHPCEGNTKPSFGYSSPPNTVDLTR